MCCGCGCGLAVAMVQAEEKVRQQGAGPAGLLLASREEGFVGPQQTRPAQSARGWEALKRSLKCLVGGRETVRSAAPVIASAA